MALFSNNITIKFQANIDKWLFEEQIDPDVGGDNSLFRGELALLSNEEGITLYSIDAIGGLAEVRPRLEELSGIDIVDPQAGHVLVFNNDGDGFDPPQYPDRPQDKWINVPAPRPNLSGNSIFELGNVSTDTVQNYVLQGGSALVWAPSTSTVPGADLGAWVMGKGVYNSVLNDFGDVSLDFVPLDGQTLVWNVAASSWQNAFYPEGLNDLLDVDISTNAPLDGDVLLYDGSQELWVPGAVSGGNANVEILTDGGPFPVKPLGTLGVTEEDVNGEGGDFYWIEKDNTDQWAKGIQTGEVTFGDFKDIDTTGIQPGQGLRWTYTDEGFKFLPTDLAPIPFYFKPPDPDGSPDVDGVNNGLFIATWGQDGGRYFTSTNRFSEDKPESQIALGMYGSTPDGGGITVRHDCPDSEQIWNSSTDLEEGFHIGALRFPEDLDVDTAAGVRGIRPLTAAGSIPWSDRSQAPNQRYTWTFRTYLIATNANEPQVLFDYGSLKVEILSPSSFKTTVSVGEGTVLESTWVTTQALSSTDWDFLSIGTRNYDFTTDTYPFGVKLNDADLFTSDGLSEIALPANARIDVPDVTQTPLPIIAPKFTGWLSHTAFILGSSNSRSKPTKNQPMAGTWPVTYGRPGQLIILGWGAGQPARFTTYGYAPETWGKEEVGPIYTSFGTSTKLENLADVDASSVGVDSGYLFYNAETAKFEVTSEAPEFQGEYTLIRARDVRTFDDNGRDLQDGDYLSYNYDRRQFEPAPTTHSFRVNDAEDVDTSGGLAQGNTLVWDATENKWIPGTVDGSEVPALNDLTDVFADPNALSDSFTLLYSEAFGGWYAGPAPSTGANTVGELSDVDDTGIEDGDVLAYDSLSQTYKPSKDNTPQYIDDLLDVDTTSRPPLDGQGLQWNDGQWAPGHFMQGGSSTIYGLYDVKVEGDLASEGQSLVWDGKYFANRDVHSGQGDGGDFDTGRTLVSYTSGVWGGGDFDTDGEDKPIELMSSGKFSGGGDFF